MKKFFTIAGILVILASIGLNIYLLTKQNKETDIEYIETIKYDTIRDTVPQLVSKTYLKTKYDTLVMRELIPGDTVRVVAEVPIEQKVFEKDSVYRAYCTGYDVNLDSIKIFYKTKEITEIRIQKDKRRWSLGPAVWGGYDINSNKLGYGVGVSVQYNLWRW